MQFGLKCTAATAAVLVCIYLYSRTTYSYTEEAHYNHVVVDNATTAHLGASNTEKLLPDVLNTNVTKVRVNERSNRVGSCCRPIDVTLQNTKHRLPRPEACAFMISNDSLIFDPPHIDGQDDPCLLADSWLLRGVLIARKSSVQHVFSIIVNIFNHQHTIERVLRQIFKTTSETYELILFFDGCTDDSIKLALQLVDSYVEGLWNTCANVDDIADPHVQCKTTTGNLIHVRAIVQPPGNSVYETTGNNIAMRSAEGKYFVLMQDDMYMTEPAWNSRLAAGPRAFDDVVSVSAMCAHNLVDHSKNKVGPCGALRQMRAKRPPQKDGDMSCEMHIRETANRGPLLLDAIKTKTLGYLDELNFRLARDDHDFHCRARVDHHWVTGHIHVGFFVLIAEGGVRINNKQAPTRSPYESRFLKTRDGRRDRLAGKKSCFWSRRREFELASNTSVATSRRIDNCGQP
eukprot:m.958537 g.958537  ORF g.958537 m.958537 type:complete len:459 (-) comp23881_c0_seq1:2553-3929(-)